MKLQFAWIALLLLCFSEFTPVHAAEFRAFETDQCTGYREGPSSEPSLWAHCCVLHDLTLWAGGEKHARRQADRDLRACVAATGATTQAKIMFLGVRLGALSPIKFAGRQWGNAWSRTKVRRTALDQTEIEQLESEILDSKYDPILPLPARRDFIQALREKNPQP